MSDQSLIDLLAQAALRVPGSDPPLRALLRDGRRGVRRRRMTVLAGSAAVVLTVAGGVAAATAHHGGDVPSPATTGPAAPPAGTRWVGIGRTVVAVPRAWSMWPGLYCPSGDGHDHVTIVAAGVTASCAPVDPRIPAGTVIALREQNGTLAVKVEFEIARSRPGVTQQGIDLTRTSLPPGWLAVPAATPSQGTSPSADDEARALEAAGFRVSRVKEPTWDDGPRVRTEPEIGAPAPLGSTITVYERVPAPAVASLSGRLLWVGGPAPGRPRPHDGTVHVVGKGLDEYVPVGPHGSWSFEGPAGTFTVTGSSPGYLSAAGVPGSCRAGRRVVLRWEQTSKVRVYCQLK